MSDRIEFDFDAEGNKIALRLVNGHGRLLERREIRSVPGTAEYLHELGEAVRNIGRGAPKRDENERDA